MRVLIILEHRFFETADGRTWTDGPFPHSFFTRYLEVFDEALVAARAEPVLRPKPDWRRADGPGVKFASTPNYIGAWQAVRKRRAVRSSLERTLDAAPDAAVILRIPSEVAMLAAPKLARDRRPFAAEVVADPYDAWSPGSARHLLRPYLRYRQTRDLRRLCARACASSYVTEAALQRRYPPAPGTPTTHYSSVELPDEAFVAKPPPLRTEPPLRLVHIGSLEHLYKGQDVLLEAIALCRDRGVALEARMIGEGRYRPFLERRRAQLGLGEMVALPGGLPAGEAVRQELDRADLFVLPSRQEGLPRAMLEAMARGLPAVSTPVGGIPEALPAEDLAHPGDAESLARLLASFAGSPQRRAEAARRNLARSRDYHNAALQGRRNQLFKQLAALNAMASASAPSSTNAAKDSNRPNRSSNRTSNSTWPTSSRAL